MKVDFKLKKSGAYTVACKTVRAKYSDRAIRKSFEQVAEWAEKQGAKTGKWIFIEHIEQDDILKWSACIELKGKAKGGGEIEVKKLDSSDVVSVTFNPDHVSSGIVYHAISDWTRWRKKDGTIARAGEFREIYSGNPWKDAAAWQSLEVQMTVVKGAVSGEGG